MKVVRLPGGEYYLRKNRGNPLMFRPKATGDKNRGYKAYYYVNFSKFVYIPEELKDKRLMFKVEVVR